MRGEGEREREREREREKKKRKRNKKCLETIFATTYNRDFCVDIKVSKWKSAM